MPAVNSEMASGTSMASSANQVQSHKEIHIPWAEEEIDNLITQSEERIKVYEDAICLVRGTFPKVEVKEVSIEEILNSFKEFVKQKVIAGLPTTIFEKAGMITLGPLGLPLDILDFASWVTTELIGKQFGLWSESILETIWKGPWIVRIPKAWDDHVGDIFWSDGKTGALVDLIDELRNEVENLKEIKKSSDPSIIRGYIECLKKQYESLEEIIYEAKRPASTHDYFWDSLYDIFGNPFWAKALEGKDPVDLAWELNNCWLDVIKMLYSHAILHKIEVVSRLYSTGYGYDLTIVDCEMTSPDLRFSEPLFGIGARWIPERYGYRQMIGIGDNVKVRVTVANLGSKKN
jgi:hypothetical protein